MPVSAKTHFELGNLALVRSEWEQAVAHYQRAIDLKPDFAVAYYNQGVCQRQLGERDAAIISFQQTCRLMPQNLPAQRDLAELLLDAGRDQEGRYHLKAAARLAPHDPGNRRWAAPLRSPPLSDLSSAAGAAP